MLSAEKIQLNWDRYVNEINTNISKERTDILIPFLNKFEERIMMMPAAAIQYMEEGDLKEKFGELQNMITISQTGNLGARGVQNIRPL